MTTARELGVTYSSIGQLRQPRKPIRLNGDGAKFVKGFARKFNDDIVDEIQEGFEILFSSGPNGSTCNVVIPTKDGKACKIPIDIETDNYFLLPNEDKQKVE